MNKTETRPQPFTYVGQHGVMAEQNNHYYMRARYYDADIGRFISEDPIGFEGGINLYAYVENNPVIFIDPLGLWDMISSYRALHSGYNPGRDATAVHYNRNQYNQTIAYKDLKREGWDGSVPAYYHRQGLGNEGNQKFVSPDGHSEAIFDSNNNPITLLSDPVNGPTYNYHDPRSNPIAHFFNDMLFYYLLGNTPDAPSSIWERITGTYNSGPANRLKGF